MDKEQLLAKVPAEWRHDFEQFIATGDAREEFLSFLDRDVRAQEVVEEAFAEQFRNFERFAEGLNVDSTAVAAQLKLTRRDVGDIVRDLSAKLGRDLQESIPLLRRGMKKDVARKVAATVSSHSKDEVIEMLDEIKANVSAGRSGR